MKKSIPLDILIDLDRVNDRRLRLASKTHHRPRQNRALMLRRRLDQAVRRLIATMPPELVR